MVYLKRVRRALAQKVRYHVFRAMGPRKLKGVQSTTQVTFHDFGLTGNHVFFGYHDRTPFSADNRVILAHAFEGQLSPVAPGNQPVRIVAFDMPESVDSPVSYRVLDSTRTWSWQQGSMMTWHPAFPASRIVYNTLENGTAKARVLDLGSGDHEDWETSFYAISRDGSRAVTLDFGKLASYRDGYGFPACSTDLGSGPANSNLLLIDTTSGKAESVLDLNWCCRRIPGGSTSLGYFNHASFSPDSKRIGVFHIRETEEGRKIVFWFVHAETGERHCLETDRLVSHYCWISDGQILVTNRDPALKWRYSVLDVESGVLHDLDVPLNRDGHPMSSGVDKMIVTDCTPDERRDQSVFLADPAFTRISQVASLHTPPRFSGPIRCDLHPRFSPDGNWLAIDRVKSGHRILSAFKIEA